MILRNVRSRWSTARTLLIWGGVALMAACASEKSTPDEGSEEKEGCGSFAEFKSRYVYIDPQGVAIVNGDTPVSTESDLQDFYSVVCGKTDDALIVNRVNGVDDKWSDAQKLNLTYCIGNTFNASQRSAVTTAMNQATAAWAAAGNVKFVHVTSQDGSCTASNNNVVFDVNLTNSGGQFLARAFFPAQPRSQRNVLVDTSSFGSIPPWTLKGILIHELGHTLGFRHEHTRPESGTCFEDNSWRSLTTYDSASVMHYPQCNGSQSRRFTAPRAAAVVPAAQAARAARAARVVRAAPAARAAAATRPTAASRSAATSAAASPTMVATATRSAPSSATAAPTRPRSAAAPRPRRLLPPRPRRLLPPRPRRRTAASTAATRRRPPVAGATTRALSSVTAAPTRYNAAATEPLLAGPRGPTS
ncbi:MAG: M57 family metalloprotease [Polyangiaceae bacterium]|nr:M57 family metalloprotease [Polyangiaceae bacterium]